MKRKEDELIRNIINAMEFGLGRRSELELSITDSSFVDFIRWQLKTKKPVKEIPAESQVIKQRDEATELALMYSGGLDSAIAYEYAYNVYGLSLSQILPVHVQYGAPYDVAELIATRRLDMTEGIIVPIQIRKMEERELDKGYIIPLRNTLLAAIGSLYAKNIWIIAHYRFEPYREDKKDRGVSDKGIKFFNKVSEILSKLRRKPVHVYSPFQHLSKADCIKWAKENLPADHFQTLVTNTITCYNPIVTDIQSDEFQREANVRNCGRCYTCWKLALSYKEAKIPGKKNFAEDPFKDPKIPEYERREKNKGR